MTDPTRLPADGIFIGRARTSEAAHPLVVAVRDGTVFDITSSAAPTVRDLCELPDPAGYVRSAKGKPIGALEDIAANSFEAERDAKKPFLLSPADLQAVKASGVTFVVSLLERVIEEQARGSAEKADAIRADIAGLIGHDLSKLKPGSPEAMEIKAKLISRGAWSQYLEVGIGPDAEIFTKCQPMASVGFGADVGLHPVSTWNNPEPEIAMIADSTGRIVGATLGNDVNLRDVEGRSALLLGKAKDNNASAALGPFIRLFDETFSIADVKRATVRLSVEGEDGFALEGASSMAEISRSPEELVKAAMGPHHQYPDGLALYLGTMFVPSKDRGEKGKGFTHKVGDIVTISSEKLGALVNRVRLSPDCPHWTYGASHLMRDLARAGLI
ncbi:MULTISPECIES: fumarylacetoacetate hydrolase family protein [unclassified Mesorhizobium]|uniref:fumarylacetoacetate hydrolase family protein n=1 Tax=unclassified Mesorhizobium TaxID=325217 RepID=UPI000FCBC10C|nr:MULTISPECIES: fumarylacetoacetate hydrolase family protein [unclassified Mesorhizobium]RUW22039.1 fumarylacetoacetate hydrolase [Mesorhizobium sp. M4B.F.Ca.ET.013.02.1.1]RVD16935.1 fumarylacetoacetate hydrolase [Mesorhizobium sp. M4B.F.Ca.ET.017.02.2.1]RVD32819.1 fumarylacetoacetate hydrolase [Mesorhizobium sp. M4B.F.Ca.ET.019.03.1.1]RWF61932.1 MAG: fumarylacetoacetate hydrolase [Mesorhizobium sp.]TGQ18761.1 fumarylacetoacetate hydrolase [Mesorhizobium sp. M4B.F.Ca.ET.215.01.1.1]